MSIDVMEVPILATQKMSVNISLQTNSEGFERARQKTVDVKY